MSVSERITDGLRAVFAADVLRLLSKGLLILLLTRYLLSPDEYGLLFLAMAIFSVALMLSELGFAMSAARFITEYRESDPSQIPHILRTTLLFNVVSITLVCLGLALFHDSIVAVVGEDRLAPLLLAGIGLVVGRTLVSYTVTMYQGFNRVSWSALVRTVHSVGQPIFVVAFILLGLGTLGAMIGYVVAAFIASLLGFYVLYTEFYTQFDPAEAREPGLAKRLLRYSIPLTATRGANVLDRRVDTIMVGVFLNPLAVAYYNLGKQVSEFVMAPAASLGFTVAPMYGQQKAKNQLDEAARVYETTVENILLLYLPAAAGIVLVADPTIRYVFGANYLGAVPVLQIFSIYVLFQSVDKLTNDGLDYLGRADARAIAKTVTAIANFLLNLVLIPTYGVVGASVATVITFAALVVVELVVIFRELPISPMRLARALARVTVITAGMAAILGYLVGHVSGLPTLLLVIGAGVVVWFFLATASGALDVNRIRSALG